MSKLTFHCPHCLRESDWYFIVKPTQDAPTPENHHNTPPVAKTSLLDPKADAIGTVLGHFKGKVINEKLWYVLEVLQAREGEPNRNKVQDFLRATGAIRKDQEPENFPIRWLPLKKPNHLRLLGAAIAEFAAGGRAEWPYPPNEVITKPPDLLTSTPTLHNWRNITLHLSKLKGTALGQLPPDVLFDLWQTFAPSKCKGTNGETIDFPADRKLRDALNAAGEELNFKKE